MLVHQLLQDLLPCLVLLGLGKFRILHNAQLLKKDDAQLPWGGDIEGFARKGVYLLFQRCYALLQHA